jgi:hypothetical protein
VRLATYVVPRVACTACTRTHTQRNAASSSWAPGESSASRTEFPPSHTSWKRSSTSAHGSGTLSEESPSHATAGRGQSASPSDVCLSTSVPAGEGHLDVEEVVVDAALARELGERAGVVRREREPSLRWGRGGRGGRGREAADEEAQDVLLAFGVLEDPVFTCKKSEGSGGNWRTGCRASSGPDDARRSSIRTGGS